MLHRGIIGVAAITAVGLLIGIIPAQAGPLEDAHAAYVNRDYATALRLWKPMAEQGNAEAENGLAALYEGGWGVPKDEDKALSLYLQAAAKGNSAAECSLGETYIVGFQGTPHDVSKGIELMQKSGNWGNASR